MAGYKALVAQQPQMQMPSLADIAMRIRTKRAAAAQSQQGLDMAVRPGGQRMGIGATPGMYGNVQETPGGGAAPMDLDRLRELNPRMYEMMMARRGGQ